MKKFLIKTFPLILSAITLLIVTVFLRYNLYISTNQLAREFQTQNAKELYSIDTLKISTRLNSFSSALNWVCIEAEAREKAFFSMVKGDCSNGIFQQKALISIPEADSIKVSFTLRLPTDLQRLFVIFLTLQIGLIFSIVFATKKSESERRKKELELYELSRRMFHDIRSPLSALNTIAENFENTDHSRELVILQSSIKRINEITNSLLDQTKKTNSIQEPQYQPIVQTIEEIINEKKQEFSSTAAIRFTSYKTANALFVSTDLKRILSNLINNAIEASKGTKAEVQVSVSQNNDTIQIILKDNGSGIPEKILKQLGNAEVSSKNNGNGLGFKTALELLKEWQGDLTVLATGKNGTTICVELKAESVLQVEEAAEVKSLVAQTILIDDDELTRTTWAMKAKKSNVAFKSYKDIDSFKADLTNISKEDILYIDSELGVEKGETLALELHNLGFKNISMASGHPPERFVEYKFLRSVISKKAPF